ncbi:MAG: ABC transporter permease [Thermoguttaceae bacterium]|nr:ABC transporter permease [Thermoguttaceae bacterium]
MVLETQFPSFGEWIQEAAWVWTVRIGIFCLIALVIGFLFTGIRMGPKRSWAIVSRAVKNTFSDLIHLSFKRIFAIAILSFKEALRRKILIGFAIFIVILLFAGMFLDTRSPDPARLYINFIFWVNAALILLLALFISAFSIPNDFKYKTIYTLATKPVRAGEIILGRILGFTLMCSAMLLVMGVVSYGFVIRSVAHTHTLTADDLRYVDTTKEGERALEGKTSLVKEHRHEVYLPPEFLKNPTGKTVMTDVNQGHSHQVSIVGQGKDRQYQLSGVKNMFTARVPVYGKLRFRDTSGYDTEKGINVGDEWEYRSFIQGSSDAALIWQFKDIKPESFPDGLPIEMTLGVFRTHKGNIERGVMGVLAVRNPETGLMVEVCQFESVEFNTKRILVPRKIKPLYYDKKGKSSSVQVISCKTKLPNGTVVYDIPENKLNPAYAQPSASGDGLEFDLFQQPGSKSSVGRSLVSSDGRVEVWVSCEDPMQYFGAAAPDLYIRAYDEYFTINFIKGFFCIWLEMFLIIVYGVILSSFLSAPIAILGTLFIMVTGVFHQYVVKLANGMTEGGGVLESMYRLLRQDNMITELPDNILGDFIRMSDQAINYVIGFVGYMAPDLSQFANSEYVASGFNIPWNLISIDAMTTLAFFIPLFFIGYLCMKLREIAA